jgi:acyl CoA:acetate/3-ketoacid CoA transferase alpha subunit
MMATAARVTVVEVEESVPVGAPVPETIVTLNIYVQRPKQPFRAPMRA